MGTFGKLYSRIRGVLNSSKRDFTLTIVPRSVQHPSSGAKVSEQTANDLAFVWTTGDLVEFSSPFQPKISVCAEVVGTRHFTENVSIASARLISRDDVAIMLEIKGEQSLHEQLSSARDQGASAQVELRVTIDLKTREACGAVTSVGTVRQLRDASPMPWNRATTALPWHTLVETLNRSVRSMWTDDGTKAPAQR